MNLDEFLRQTEELADEREGASPHRVYRLLALVRKLREQRDVAIKSACASPEVNLGPKTWDEMASRDIAVDNAALDEIVREG